MLNKPRYAMRVVPVFAIISILVSVYIFLGTSFTLDERSNLSMAVSTIFAIMLGLYAVFVALKVESVEHKSSMENKKSILSLACALRSIMERNFTARLMKSGASLKNNYFEKELDVISDFFVSPSYYALVSWSAKQKSRNRWQVFFIELHEILLKNNAEKENNKLKSLVETLQTLTEDDFEDIEKTLKDISASMNNFRNSNKTFLPFIAQDIEGKDGKAENEKCTEKVAIETLLWFVKNCEKDKEYKEWKSKLNKVLLTKDLYKDKCVKELLKRNREKIDDIPDETKKEAVLHLVDNNTPPLPDSTYEKVKLDVASLERLIERLDDSNESKKDLVLSYFFQKNDIEGFKKTLLNEPKAELRRWQFSDLTSIGVDVAKAYNKDRRP